MNQFVTVTDDPKFYMGTVLLCANTPYTLLTFGIILYHLGKLILLLFRLSFFVLQDFPVPVGKKKKSRKPTGMEEEVKECSSSLTMVLIEGWFSLTSDSVSSRSRMSPYNRVKIENRST